MISDQECTMVILDRYLEGFASSRKVELTSALANSGRTNFLREKAYEALLSSLCFFGVGYSSPERGLLGASDNKCSVSNISQILQQTEALDRPTHLS